MNFSFLGNTSSPWFWVAWSLALVWQNYAFTRVSRARNSGSLKAHALAAIQSNGVWFLQSLFVYSAFMNILTGKAGWVKAVGAALYYTVFTMAGSLYAHYTSLKKEKGATAVGANKKYAQITTEEWEKAKNQISILLKAVQAPAMFGAPPLQFDEFGNMKVKIMGNTTGWKAQKVGGDIELTDRRAAVRTEVGEAGQQSGAGQESPAPSDRSYPSSGLVSR